MAKPPEFNSHAEDLTPGAQDELSPGSPTRTTEDEQLRG
jgi:hypothetical protein